MKAVEIRGNLRKGKGRKQSKKRGTFQVCRHLRSPDGSSSSNSSISTISKQSQGILSPDPGMRRRSTLQANQFPTFSSLMGRFAGLATQEESEEESPSKSIRKLDTMKEIKSSLSFKKMKSLSKHPKKEKVNFGRKSHIRGLGPLSVIGKGDGEITKRKEQIIAIIPRAYEKETINEERSNSKSTKSPNISFVKIPSSSSINSTQKRGRINSKEEIIGESNMSNIRGIRKVIEEEWKEEGSREQNLITLKVYPKGEMPKEEFAAINENRVQSEFAAKKGINKAINERVQSAETEEELSIGNHNEVAVLAPTLYSPILQQLPFPDFQIHPSTNIQNTGTQTSVKDEDKKRKGIEGSIDVNNIYAKSNIKSKWMDRMERKAVKVCKFPLQKLSVDNQSIRENMIDNYLYSKRQPGVEHPTREAIRLTKSAFKHTPIDSNSQSTSTTNIQRLEVCSTSLERQMVNYNINSTNYKENPNPERIPNEELIMNVENGVEGESVENIVENIVENRVENRVENIYNKPWRSLKYDLKKNINNISNTPSPGLLETPKIRLNILSKKHFSRRSSEEHCLSRSYRRKDEEVNFSPRINEILEKEHIQKMFKSQEYYNSLRSSPKMQDIDLPPIFTDSKDYSPQHKAPVKAHDLHNKGILCSSTTRNLGFSNLLLMDQQPKQPTNPKNPKYSYSHTSKPPRAPHYVYTTNRQIKYELGIGIQPQHLFAKGAYTKSSRLFNTTHQWKNPLNLSQTYANTPKTRNINISTMMGSLKHYNHSLQ